MSEDLFGGTVGAPPATGGGSLADADRAGLPLAVRMRPRTLDEIVGQSHLLAPGSPLRRLAAGEAMSVFLWGLLHTGVESHLSGVALIMLIVIASAGLVAALALGWSRARAV